MVDSMDRPTTRKVTGRFVVLRHTLPADSGRSSHWDLMLEDGEVLRTWELGSLLFLESAASTGSETLAPEAPPQTPRPLPDHRLAYLDYEGPVSENRGTVMRVAMGVHESVEDTHTNQWTAQLNGAFNVDHPLVATLLLPRN